MRFAAFLEAQPCLGRLDVRQPLVACAAIREFWVREMADPAKNFCALLGPAAEINHFGHHRRGRPGWFAAPGIDDYYREVGRG
jgi:hypothetical protein